MTAVRASVRPTLPPVARDARVGHDDAVPTGERLTEERQRLIDAAWTFLERSSYESLKVQQVARAAGLSTRGFYRHFAGKEELLSELRAAELSRATAILRERTATGTPEERVAAWIDAVVSLRYGRRAGPRARLFSTLGPLAGGPESAGHGPHDTAQPLIDAIAAGKEAGVFPNADPEVDGRLIAALCTRLDQQAVSWLPEERVEGVAVVVSFALRSLTHPGP